MRSAVGWFAVGVLIVYLLAPIIVVFLFAFQGSSNTTLPFTGPSLRWVGNVFGDERFRSALFASLRVGAATAVLSALIGLLAALATSRKMRGKGVFRAIAMLPLVVAPVFIGVSMLVSAGDFGLDLSLWLVLVAHVLLTAPICWAVLDSAFERFDVLTEEAARDLGGNALQAFLHVRLPAIWRSLVGAAMIAFAFSIEEFAVTNFVVGSTPTLPILVWGKMRRTIDPSINVVAVTILVLMLLVGIFGWLMVQRSSRKAAQALELEEAPVPAPGTTATELILVMEQENTHV
ncbi:MULTISPECIES: ABC transporter permease [unclassified Pseudarthrobacter]|uniref:ABC transporter permease n=1 Tax=unclassified Pseudarthrobacter TaxID=2647000 RepID=UPI003076A0E8